MFCFDLVVADLLKKVTVFGFEFELRLNSHMHDG